MLKLKGLIMILPHWQTRNHEVDNESTYVLKGKIIREVISEQIHCTHT
jgi:hypothetical protein